MSNIRNVVSLVFNPDALDIPSAMKIIALVNNGSVGIASLPEFMEIVARMVEGGLDDVPYAQMDALVNRALGALSEATNPKSESAASETT